MRSPTLALTALAISLACTIDDTDSQRPASTASDASATPDAYQFPKFADAAPRPDAPVMPTFDAAVPVCRDSVMTEQSGHHNAGLPCLDCHYGEFGAAGTLFTNADDEIPIEGAHVQIIDADGLLFEMVTAKNGNFWTREQPRAPFTAFTSDCPNLTLMPELAPSGNCNECHFEGRRVHPQ